MAALFTLKSFAGHESDCEILLRIDNVSSEKRLRYQWIKLGESNTWGSIKSYANSGSSASRETSGHTRRPLKKKNVETDRVSRTFNIDTEWELADWAFRKITETFGAYDLFAIRINRKCTKFCSWRPDRETYTIDAFSISWKDKHFYAFPSFALILPTLKKIIHDGVTEMIIIPRWPTQPWYPLFEKLLICKTIVFKPASGLSISLCRTQRHPLAAQLTLTAGSIRKAYISRNFSSEVATILADSVAASTLKQYNGPLKNWQIFCNQKNLNPFQADVTC